MFCIGRATISFKPHNRQMKGIREDEINYCIRFSLREEMGVLGAEQEERGTIIPQCP